MVTNSFNVSQGVVGGAAVNVHIKSGTNTIHGEAYESNMNNALEARPYAFVPPPPGQANPKLINNDFGGTIGGPIKKNKLFYFVSYEGNTLRQEGQRLETVPTAAFRAGDFSSGLGNYACTNHLVPAPAHAVCGTQSEIAIDRPYGAFVYPGPGAIEPVGSQPELKRRFLGFDRVGSFIDPQGDGGAQILRNRLRLREGPGAIDAEHLAGLASGIHLSLLNSHPEALSDDVPISLFNAWPKDWDAAFTLLARGAFVVSSAQRDGVIPLVEIFSRNGGPCRLRNPWPGQSVSLYRNGHKADDLSGEVLAFPTSRKEAIVIVPSGVSPEPVRMN